MQQTFFVISTYSIFIYSIIMIFAKRKTPHIYLRYFMLCYQLLYIYLKQKKRKISLKKEKKNENQ